MNIILKSLLFSVLSMLSLAAANDRENIAADISAIVELQTRTRQEQRDLTRQIQEREQAELNLTACMIELGKQEEKLAEQRRKREEAERNLTEQMKNLNAMEKQQMITLIANDKAEEARWAEFLAHTKTEETENLDALTRQRRIQEEKRTQLAQIMRETTQRLLELNPISRII